MLDVTRLRVLAAVAEHGSVTAAAKALGYTQPSISHHLARLEAETGAKLLQRAGRGVRLTAAGSLLADRAAEILGRLDATEAELAAHVGLRQGRVRLAAFPSALGTLVPRAVAELGAAHPGLDVSLVEAEPPEAVRMLRAGHVDVAVIFAYGEVADDPRTVELLTEPVYLLTPETWPDHGGSLRRHAGDRWIGGCERCRTQLRAMCGAAGFDPRISFTTDDYVAVQALVAAGLGVATLPRLALDAARNPRVRATAIPGTDRHVRAALYGDPPEPPPTAALLAALRSAARSTGGWPRDSGKTPERGATVGDDGSITDR